MASFRSRIIGTWDLVYYIAINAEDPNDVVYPMGKDAKGQIMYTHDGYMAALLQAGDLRPFEHDWNHGTTEELAAAAKKTMAYGGPFYLDEEGPRPEPGTPRTIIHHAQISMHPNLIDTLQVRRAELFQEDGHEYIMLGPESPTEWEGTRRLLRLKWRKRDQNNATKPPREARELKL
ncbi:hypothetical protein A1O7_08858 [Cladophialophora yegresii CBS 114405]|uniref:Lipocalin-like domain-containing protein n=1 Tax=Cladophialophora yegresii CBS 114405 TaxID=1182544 RepID=W9VJS5_9EURO|nr:uncharacterized protein A1O7_08858 [Cladophialophora yegresii CBS 114405]EXJ55927.1 hypothetical protein A1O7_08858 [Cladophialophora yegresii CBS 114405]